MRTAPSSDTGNEASVVSFASPSADDGTLQLGKVRTDVAHLKTDLATVARKWEAASSTISLRLARQESRVEGLSTRTEVLDLARARLEDWVTEISRTGNGSNCPSLLPPIGSLHAPMTPAT
jgi:hypothetical protein